MNKKVAAFLCIFLVANTLNADSWSDIGDKFKDFGNTIGDTAKSMVNGFKAMGGEVDKDYVYSFRVFNGVQDPVKVEIEGAQKIMGARIDGDTRKSLTIDPGKDSGATFNNTHLYFSIEIDDCDFTEDHYILGKKNDDTVYAYHTYQDSTQAKHAEKVGLSNTTSEFSGMIYNGASRQSSVGFSWKGKRVSVPVEADTYCTLKTVGQNVVRPFTLQLNNTNIAVGQNGLGTVVTSGEGTDATQQTYPTRYNYEIIPNGAVETGLAPGNFKQPTNGKVRDITPVDIYIWNQPPEQANENASIYGFDMPSQPLWFAYTGQAISSSGTIVDKPMGIIPSGKCIVTSLLRPPVAQNLAKLYILRLNTTNRDKAKAFVASLLATELPRYDITIAKDSLTQEQKNTLLTQKLPDKVGEITAQDVKGYIMGTDLFTSYGLASAGPYYYTVPCPQYSVGAVISTVTQFLSNLNSDMQKTLSTNIVQWIKDYPTKPQDVRTQVETFLIQNGPSQFVVKGQDSSSLNAQGRSILSTVLYGPTSISKMSVWYQKMTNTSGKAPDKWVEPANVITL